MLAVFVGAAAAMGACYGLTKFWSGFRFVVPHEDEVLVAVYLRCVDDEEAGAPPSDEEYVERATKINCRPAHLKLSVRAAVAAKKRFGLLSDTTANQDLISDYVRQGWGQQQKLSDAVIVNVYPLAVAVALIPSEQDIEASHERARMGARSHLGRADIQTEKQVLLAVLCSFALQRFRDLHLRTAAACISCTTFRTSVFLLCSKKTLKGLAVIWNTKVAAGVCMTSQSDLSYAGPVAL